MAVAGRSEDEYIVDGNEALELALIRDSDDISSGQYTFKPTMCHQIFGPRETIYGYKNLKVQVYFSAGSLNPYLAITYSDKINTKKGSDVEADDIEKIITQKLEITFNRNLDEFIRLLGDEARFKPMGSLKHTFKVASDDTDRTYVVYKCETSTIGLIPYHERLQTFIFWFIDAASYIDTDDDKWQFFLLFEKYSGSTGEEQHAIAGFATVYEYWAYPEHLRPRISQMLVLPPFQHQGLGAELLQTVYSHYQSNTCVKDITVEDPSDELQSVRDFVDCQLLLELPELKPTATAAPLTRDEVRKAAQKLNINKKQARRLYEILRLMRISRENAEEYRTYRLEVKARLNSPHQHELSKLSKLEKLMLPQEIAELKSSLMLAEETRMSTLETAYKELEQQYDRVINRLQVAT